MKRHQKTTTKNTIRMATMIAEKTVPVIMASFVLSTPSTDSMKLFKGWSVVQWWLDPKQ